MPSHPFLTRIPLCCGAPGFPPLPGTRPGRHAHIGMPLEVIQWDAVGEEWGVGSVWSFEPAGGGNCPPLRGYPVSIDRAEMNQQVISRPPTLDVGRGDPPSVPRKTHPIHPSPLKSLTFRMEIAWHAACTLLRRARVRWPKTPSAREAYVGIRTDGQKVQETAKEILRYLVDRPQAEDTLEGIARWWLERRRIDQTVDEVGESLDLLVARGMVEVRLEKTRLARYRMNTDKQKQIATFLK